MKHRMVTFLVVALSFFSVSAHALSLDVTFSLPATREDGSKLAVADLAQCRLYDVTGTAPVKIGDMGLAGAYIYSTTAIGAKKYAADCVDKNGLASKLSQAVTVTLGSSSPPNPPSIDLKVIYTITGTLR